MKRAKERSCPECEGRFTPEYGDKRNKFCSSVCGTRYNRRIGKARRRARRLSNGPCEFVDPFKVFTRHHWHCQSCGKFTPRGARGTIGKDAPELDHIIPLSKGGTHTHDNCQLLCRECNGNKADGPSINMRDIKELGRAPSIRTA